MNNGKYYTEDYKRKQNEKIDRNFGPVEEHKKVCERCNQEYVFVGRKKQSNMNNLGIAVEVVLTTDKIGGKKMPPSMLR